jgi:alpha-ketoglutarate-dependent taurine dioxygenase
MEDLSIRILRMFGEMDSHRLDLHVLFEAAGNEPSEREALLSVIEELRRVEAELSQPLAWQPDDVLMVDNTRYLHGRRKFSDMSREIYVRLSSSLKVNA